MALSAFICLSAFPYHPSFPPCDNFRTPSPISLPQTGGEGTGWRDLKDTRFQQVFVREKYLSKGFVSKGLESEFTPS